MHAKSVQVIIILLLADFALSSIVNGTKEGPNNLLETRRSKKNKKEKKGRSTSSSSGEKDKSSKDGGDSLEMTSDTSTSIESAEDNQPKSSRERTGWRKWHRKCPPCPEDMKLKWKDPRVKWICGGYQRARRSFKSLCMMHYRNCQDGTMFVKIHDYRCEPDSVTGQRHGDHFFYDYKVHLEGDSSKSDDTSSSDDDSESSV